MRSAIYFAKRYSIFVEFYIYCSKYSSYYSNAETITKDLCGVSMLVVHKGVESVYYIDDLNVSELLSVLTNDFGFELLDGLRDESIVNEYGFSLNEVINSNIEQKISEFMVAAETSVNEFSISIDFEHIVVYSNDKLASDVRVYQKLLITYKNKIIKTRASHNLAFVGDLHACDYNLVRGNDIQKTSGYFDKKSKIILFPQSAGILIHETCGHMLEGDSYKKGNPFYKKLGKK